MRQSINNMVNPGDDSENFDFAQFLRGRIKERGLNLKKLSEVSGIATKHLEAIASGSFHNVPSVPYFRGYILRLGQILDFDGESWWAKLKEETGSIKSSETEDAPSGNRFVCVKNKKIVVLAIAAILLIVLFLGFGLARISGKPVIKITSPIESPATVSASEVDIAGTLKNASELYINGELINPDTGGFWSKTVLLGAGTNSFEIRAKKFLGGETKIIEQIIYEPATTATSTPKR